VYDNLPEATTVGDYTARLINDVQLLLRNLPELEKAFPLAEKKSFALQEFQGRLHFGIVSLTVLSLLGFFGFSGRFARLEFLNNLYLVMLGSLALATSSSYYFCKFFLEPQASLNSFRT
jgi:hypothetical protein